MRLLTLIAAVTLAAAPAAARAPAATADLAWLSGTWVQEQDGVIVRETWNAPVQGAMAGVGQTHRLGRKVSTEFMTITDEAAGTTFTAYLKGQPATPFLLKPGPAGEAVFENLGHDFPQRVIYRKCGEDLCARIEGMVDGRLKGMDWRYRRLP